MKLSYKSIVTSWSVFTIFTMLLLGIALYIRTAKTFFALLAGISLFILVLIIIFKSAIMNGLLKLSKAVQEAEASTANQKFVFETMEQKRWGRFFTGIVMGLGLYFVILSIANVDEYYRLVVEEDGLFQYLSSFFWFLAFVSILFRLIKAIKNKEGPPQSGYYLTASVMFFLFFGEEISWGQRIFDLATPEVLQKINVQEEITLHNIGSISIFSNSFFLLMISFFFVLPYLLKKRPKMLHFFQYFEIPHPQRFTIYVFAITFFTWIFIGIRFGTLGFHPFSIYPQAFNSQMDDEVFEFLSAVTFFVFAVMENVKGNKNNKTLQT